MVKRRGQYYLRIRCGGRDKLLALGADFTAAKQRYHQLKGLDDPGRGRITVNEFSAQWQVGYVATQRSAQNRKLVAQRMRDHVLPVLGKKLMCLVTKADIRAVRASLEAKKLATFTVRHVLSDIRCMFKFAVDEVELMDQSPFHGKLMPQKPDLGPQRLSDEEVAQALAVVPPQYERLVRFELLSGLRWGELRGLLWDAVVYGERPHVIVRRSHDGPTKTRKVWVVPLTEEAERLLRAARRSSVYVFPGRSGGMMGRNACGLNRIIRRSVPGFTFRRLRHTFASRAREAGLSTDDLRRVLGHSTVTMTEHYAQASDDSVWAKMRAINLNLPKTVNETGNSASETLAEAGGNR